MNKTIGHITCPLCKTPGEVRRYKDSERGKMYWHCECGQMRPASIAGQKYIRVNAEFYEDAGPLAPEGGRVFKPHPQAAPAAAPVTKKPEPEKPAAPVTKKPEPEKPAAPVTKKPEPEKPAAPVTKDTGWGLPKW